MAVTQTYDDAGLDRLQKYRKKIKQKKIAYGVDSRTHPKTGEPLSKTGEPLSNIVVWLEYGTKNADGSFRIQPRDLGQISSLHFLPKLDNLTKYSLSKYLDGNTLTSCLDNIGDSAVEEWKQKIEMSLSYVDSNEQSTIDQKGFDHPWVDTGYLQQNITHWTENK